MWRGVRRVWTFHFNFKVKKKDGNLVDLELQVRLQGQNQLPLQGQLKRVFLVLAPPRPRDYAPHFFFFGLRLLRGGC